MKAPTSSDSCVSNAIFHCSQDSGRCNSGEVNWNWKVPHFSLGMLSHPNPASESRSTTSFSLGLCDSSSFPSTTHIKMSSTTTKEHRKSVAFSEGTTVVSSEGEVTKVNGTSDKASAESHSMYSILYI